MLPTREDGRKLPGWLSFALLRIGLPALQAPLLLLMLAAGALIAGTHGLRRTRFRRSVWGRMSMHSPPDRERR